MEVSIPFEISSRPWGERDPQEEIAGASGPERREESDSLGEKKERM